MPKLKALFLESGHGRTKNWLGQYRDDNGANSKIFKGETERKFTVDMVRRVYAILRQNKELKDTLIFGVGAEERLTATEKVNFINSAVKSHYFKPEECAAVSFHFNTGGGNGSEVWYQKSGNQKSIALGQEIIDSLREYAVFNIRPRPLRPTNENQKKRLYIDDTRVPYVLVEHCFLDSAKDMGTLMDETKRARLAMAIAHGVMEYVRSN